jgi:AraC-like DNA-binding protein
LAPLVLKEIHFRLLRAQHGGMLRQLLRHDSPANRISKSIAIIRMNFRNTLSVANLATESGMSLSAFHEHFKSVTATTPLQYQKELRLLEAQRLLLSGNATVASAAFDVGYESPTQFSREFSRKFGLSPNDLKSASALYAV